VVVAGGGAKLTGVGTAAKVLAALTS